MTLSDRSRQIVSNARRAYAPAPTDRQRVRRALAIRLVVGATVASGMASAGSAVSAVASKVAVVGIGAATLVGAGVVAYEVAPRFVGKVRGPTPTAVKPMTDPTPVGALRPQGATPPKTGAEAPNGAQAIGRVESRGRSERRATEQGSAPSPASASAGRRPDVEAELVLLGKAQRALSSGAAARALELTEQHARAFPAGTLSEERQATRIVALCALGRVSEGRAEGRAFLARSGSSPLAERVRTACSSKGGTP
jgi:hypothetical protein